MSEGPFRSGMLVSPNLTQLDLTGPRPGPLRARAETVSGTGR
jgi:hypothetical protein